MKSAPAWGCLDLPSTVSVQPPSVAVGFDGSPSTDGNGATAVFAIIFNTAFTFGSGVFASLLKYVVTVVAGLLLQRLTTRQPTIDQVEVAVASLRAVLTAEQLAEVDARPRRLAAARGTAPRPAFGNA